MAVTLEALLDCAGGDAFDATWLRVLARFPHALS